MSKATRIQGREWTPEEVKALKQLVKANTPRRVIGLYRRLLQGSAGRHFTKAYKPIAIRLI